MSLLTLWAIIKYVSKPKSTAVKDIDIADSFGQKYRYCIDIGKSDIDLPVQNVQLLKNALIYIIQISCQDHTWCQCFVSCPSLLHKILRKSMHTAQSYRPIGSIQIPTYSSDNITEPRWSTSDWSSKWNSISSWTIWDSNCAAWELPSSTAPVVE